MRSLILLSALVPELVLGECAIVAPAKKLPIFEVSDVRSADTKWVEYSSKNKFPQISDDYIAPPIKEHCIVTLKNENSTEIFDVIQSKKCSELIKGESYKYHVYEICSEWGKDFYSFLGLKGAFILGKNNEI